VRKLVITQNVTVDGSVEMLDGWFDAQGQGEVDNADLLATMDALAAESDALVLGRRTFEDMRGYWPSVTDDATGISASLNAQQKFVVSATMTDPGWQNSTVLSGDPVTEVGKLKHETGRDIVVTGSIRLCHALIGAGLVDEYRLFVYPVVQGRGRRLFPQDHAVSNLRRVQVQDFRGGITLLRYASA
jgi:dihydrofolate reductase